MGQMNGDRGGVRDLLSGRTTVYDDKHTQWSNKMTYLSVKIKKTLIKIIIFYRCFLNILSHFDIIIIY